MVFIVMCSFWVAIEVCVLCFDRSFGIGDRWTWGCGALFGLQSKSLFGLGGDTDAHPYVSFTINLVWLMMNKCSFVPNWESGDSSKPTIIIGRNQR